MDATQLFQQLDNRQLNEERNKLIIFVPVIY